MENSQNHLMKQVYNVLEQTKQIPMWGSIPNFDWHKFSDNLLNSLKTENLSVEFANAEWIEKEKMQQILQSNNSVEIIKIPPFEGQASWIISKQDKDRICSYFTGYTGFRGFSEGQYSEGFYKYLLLECLDSFESASIYPELHPHLENESPQNEDFFVFNVTIKLDQTSIWGKFAISSRLKEEIKNHYSSKKNSLQSHPLSKDLELLLKVEIASVSLTVNEWNSLQHGDFLILDRCSFDPSQQKGYANILLEQTPLFRTKIKKNSLKIQDYAFFYEEQPAMTDDETNEDQDFSKELEHLENFSETDEDLMDSEEEHLWSEKSESKQSTEDLISSREIPITISVEVDRIRMNLDKLLQLSPGNVLELSVKPEQGVYLTVGGKRVARAELIKIGDVTGLKILKIGD